MINRKITARERWFIDRVGKRVYRNQDTCDCPVCISVYKNGLTIADDYHALYLSEIEAISAIENEPVKYFDTKQEALDFEKTLGQL